MKTLLLVDDEVEILNSLGEILSRFGYKVITMPDAKSALSVIHGKTPVDLVITDYRMPGMDGLGVFEYVNKPIKALELARIVKAALESADGSSVTHGANDAGSDSWKTSQN